MGIVLTKLIAEFNEWCNIFKKMSNRAKNTSGRASFTKAAQLDGIILKQKSKARSS